MSNESRSPDLKVGELRYDLDDANRDNIESIRIILDNIAEILVDIDIRLTALGG